MSETMSTSKPARHKYSAISAAVVCALVLLYVATAQTNQPAQSTQKGFATPEDAAHALVGAADADDVSALLNILGPDAREVVASQDPVADKNRSEEFARLAREKVSIDVESDQRVRATISVGNDNWPFPIPLIQRNGQWYFDTKAGREQMLFRRIGENELDAIAICRGFVDAEKQYASQKHDGSEINQYAQRIISTPGKHDGLAWQNADGTWGGPVGERVAEALAEGYAPGKPGFHGYYFKVLKGQGPNAPLGRMNFMVEGVMIGGFALAAAPVQYRVTGVKTFMVSYEGIVYEKDLGPDTLQIFQSMDFYNPDKTWHITDDDEDDSVVAIQHVPNSLPVTLPTIESESLLTGIPARYPGYRRNVTR